MGTIQPRAGGCPVAQGRDDEGRMLPVAAGMGMGGDRNGQVKVVG